MEGPDPESPFWKALRITYKSARRIVVGVVGLSMILVGIAMLVLPGPALVVIPMGLAILGAEFAFARRWLRVLRIQARNGLNTIGMSRKRVNRAVRRNRTPGPARTPSFEDPSAFDAGDREGPRGAASKEPTQAARNVRT